MKPELGKTYEVNHKRKGKFNMRVDRIDDEWAHGTVISGVARAMIENNVVGEGEPISIRISFATFTPIEP